MKITLSLNLNWSNTYGFQAFDLKVLRLAGLMKLKWDSDTPYIMYLDLRLPCRFWKKNFWYVKKVINIFRFRLRNHKKQQMLCKNHLIFCKSKKNQQQSFLKSNFYKKRSINLHPLTVFLQGSPYLKIVCK